MSELVTPYGKIEYKPTLLEEKIESLLTEKKAIRFPDARELILRGAPERGKKGKTEMTRSYFGKRSDWFYGIIYTKEFCSPSMHSEALAETVAELSFSEVLKEFLNAPSSLNKETVTFVTRDGIAMIEHLHNPLCDDHVDLCYFEINWKGQKYKLPSDVPRRLRKGAAACEYVLDRLIDTESMD